MKAIIVTGGKQYLVTEGSVLYVVLYVDGKVGTPTVKGASVTATVLKHGKQKKIRVFKYKNKTKSSRVTKGHRQPYTKIEIKKIVG